MFNRESISGPPSIVFSRTHPPLLESPVRLQAYRKVPSRVIKFVVQNMVLLFSIVAISGNFTNLVPEKVILTRVTGLPWKKSYDIVTESSSILVFVVTSIVNLIVFPVEHLT